ncbi:MAG: hypothetical protein VB013_08295 [Anaerolineaceae bacterium]|nr:hypothetical protein [Anaerolineaceae bacterium]
MPKRDRFYIEDNLREKINQQIKNYNFLNMGESKNKEIFLYAVALGVDAPIQMSGKKEGLLLDKDLDFFDESLLYAVALQKFNNINDIAEKNIVYDYVENCANRGFRIIFNTIDNSSLENIDKQLLIELNEKYEKLSIT